MLETKTLLNVLEFRILFLWRAGPEEVNATECQQQAGCLAATWRQTASSTRLAHNTTKSHLTKKNAVRTDLLRLKVSCKLVHVNFVVFNMYDKVETYPGLQQKMQ